jgi:hypothetical protein
MRIFRTQAKRFLFVLCLVFFARGLSAQPIRVDAAVEKKEVYLGESFLFQLQVEGHAKPELPEIRELDGFLVESRGGQTNNSQSITIVNGDMKRVTRYGFVASYQLTPTKTGVFTIPSMTVMVDGQAHQTRAIPVTVKKPQETADFKFRLAFSKETCYVGEPVLLTGIWYLAKNVSDVQFTIPFLQGSDFTMIPLKPSQATRRDSFEIPLNGTGIIAQQGQGVLAGKKYTTLTFQVALIPGKAGNFHAERAVVSSKARSSSRRSPFDDMFGRGGQYTSVVTPAPPVTLDVLSLPTAGRPASFNGLVGVYEIEANAAPTEVNVGDPITLTLRIRGDAYLDHVKMPALDKQPAMADNFKIPTEAAAGKIEGREKVFSQTLRAQHSGITEIPAIELSYFDTERGEYRSARSTPIPLTVRETKVVTLSDMEGSLLPVARTQLTARNEGIAHNYSGPEVLVNQAYELNGLRGSALLLLLPPLAYAALAAWVLQRRRRAADPAGEHARKAFALWQKSLDSVSRPTELLDALRAYLGAKLNRTPGALTFEDVREPLKARGVSEESLAALKALFDEVVAHQYAGGAGADNQTALRDQAHEAVAKLEKELAR